MTPEKARELLEKSASLMFECGGDVFPIKDKVLRFYSESGKWEDYTFTGLLKIAYGL